MNLLLRSQFFKLFAVAVLLCIVSLRLNAQEGDTLQFNGGVANLTEQDRPIPFYLLDVPLNFTGGYYYPSWNQSMHLTEAVHQTVGRQLDKWISPIHPLWGKVGTIGASVGFNVLHAFLPTGVGWMHQEAHRAVMRESGIYGSYNEANNFKLFSMRIATQKVTDQQLIDFKANHTSAFIRNRGAGHESQLEMIQDLKKDIFQYNTPVYRDLAPMLINTYIVVSFINESRKSDFDELIDKRNRDEAFNPEIRDISGVEFTPWVYDMFRPDEAYDERGTNISKYHDQANGGKDPNSIQKGEHPYGVGVDRYIGNEDLTSEEAAFLKKEGQLAFINLISPTLFGFGKFNATNPITGKDFSFNVNAIHNVTAFGHYIDASLFYQQGNKTIFFTLHNYKNKEKYFPGFEVELNRYKMPWGFLTAGISLWAQPENLSFYDTKSAPGACFKISASTKIAKQLEVFGSGDMKTAGFVALNENLDAAARFQLGINWLH